MSSTPLSPQPSPPPAPQARPPAQLPPGAGLAQLEAYRTRPVRRVLGLMSGMSMDGLDLALVRIAGRPPGLEVVLEASQTRPYDEALRARIRAATTGGLPEAVRLGYDLAARWAGDVLGFLEAAGVARSDVHALASHGQTLAHLPRAAGAAGGGQGAATWQVGDGDLLAELTGLLTVSDFRPRDIAAGGEGAPLVPYADWCLWARPGTASAAVNLGSIANVTVVTADPAGVLAFDVGPANALVDGFARDLAGPHGGIDRDGRLSAQGTVHAGLLAALEAHGAAFAALPPPKSAGFQHFGPAVAAALAARFPGVAGPDRVRTAVEYTARTLAAGLARFVRPRHPGLVQGRLRGGATPNPPLCAAGRAALAAEGFAAEALEPAFS
ncbi:MAG: anhydro-N-acetylmuramic acid kinase, partial [Planctomycetia bacterium]